MYFRNFSTLFVKYSYTFILVLTAAVYGSKFKQYVN